MKANFHRFFIFLLLCGGIFQLAFPVPDLAAGSEIAAAAREAAYRENNVGVAQLEQFNHREGADAFRRALALDPNLKLAQINLAIALFNAQDLDGARQAAATAAANSPAKPQPQYILGLIAKSGNRADDAVAAFQNVLKIDPQDVGANVNLGQIYIQQRKYPEAVKVFRVALDAEPYNATAMYALATALLRSNSRDEGQKLMANFQTLRASGASTNIGQNYLEQGRYAEAVASTGVEDDLVDKTAPKITFKNTELGFSNSSAVQPKKSKNSKSEFHPSAVLFDLENDGDLDLVKIGADSIEFFRNDGGKFSELTAASGDLNKPTGTVISGAVAGDFDNDGFADLLVFGSGQPTLFRSDGKGAFQNVTAAAKFPVSDITSISGAFVDADHDGDLDIFLGGFSGAKNNAAANRLWRNNGDGSFTDISAAAKINALNHAVAVIPTDFDNRRDIDLFVLNQNGAPKLFRNLRDTTFKDVSGEVGLNQTASWTCAAAGDFNKDSYTDFFFGRADGAGVFAVSDGRGKFVFRDAPQGTENAASAQFLDYDNDGLIDLVVNTGKGFAVVRNLGDAWTNADYSIFPNAKSQLTKTRQFLAADLNEDGNLDLLVFDANHNLLFLQNSGAKNYSENVRLQGRVSNRGGVGAKIDLRAGSLTQKLESYSASPMPAPSDIHFGLGKRAQADAIRIIWTSGVIQAETDLFDKPANQTAKNTEPIKILELDRKPSSCPYLYVWNGEKYEFISDFMGGGEMGDWIAPGVYNSSNPEEYVRIGADKLKPKDGRYEIRVTSELEEVLFVDNLKLVAVEHDADAEVYPNEGLGIPKTNGKIFSTTRGEHAPLSAVNTDGRDVLPKISSLDREFYDDFKSTKIRGYAEKHSLTLNLDDRKNYAGRTLLLLTGWTDYAFSSDNLAASHSGKSQTLPSLQVKNKRGEWQTVIDSIGISIGRPQTVVVDLTGKFLTGSREVRIVTNYKTYWDKIAVDTSEPSDIKKIELAPAQADLRTRGFSAEQKINEMIVPDYDKVLFDDRWKNFSGRFTRTGDVKSLLSATDDVFVIAKTGDEFVLSFNELPAPPAGKKYTFMLYADGFSKEMDINSASPEAVFPLPFKGMTKYPYPKSEHYPMTAEKQKIYDETLTRFSRGGLAKY